MTDVTATAAETKVSATERTPTNAGWLCLKRCIGQDIVINHEIVVRILDVGGGQVKLGVKAPLAMAVYRKEIEDALNADNGKEKAAAIMRAAKNQTGYADIGTLREAPAVDFGGEAGGA